MQPVEAFFKQEKLLYTLPLIFSILILLIVSKLEINTRANFISQIINILVILSFLYTLYFALKKEKAQILISEPSITVNGREKIEFIKTGLKIKTYSRTGRYGMIRYMFILNTLANKKFVIYTFNKENAEIISSLLKNYNYNFISENQ